MNFYQRKKEKNSSNWNNDWNTEAAVLRLSAKEVFFKILWNFLKKHLCRNHIFKKEAPAQVFSFEFHKIFENTFFIKHIWATAKNKKTEKTQIFRKVSFFLPKYIKKLFFFVGNFVNFF